MLGSLSAKDKRTLKSRGQTLADDCHLGKAGLTEAFLQHVNDLIVRKELIKLRFDDVEGAMRKEMASELAAIVNAHCVAVVGKTMLLYRPNPTLPREKRVLKPEV